MKQIQILKQTVSKRTILEKIVKPEIEFDLIPIRQKMAHNVNRVD
jgi:hypothetical protein